MKGPSLALGAALAFLATGEARVPVAHDELTGVIELEVGDAQLQKRYVLRFPSEPGAWNRKLVVGAHGGAGGNRYDLEGRVVGTDETALDDVIGDYALEQGFAYASLDRDGIGGTREGTRLTYAFTSRMKERLEQKLDFPVARTYLFGLSMGGGVSRYAAEDDPPVYDGVVLIAGAGGDLPTRLERQVELAALWPAVDPRRHPDLPDGDARLEKYAEAAGTEVGARPFWPFIGAAASLDGLAKSLAELGLPDLSREELEHFRVANHHDDTPFMERLEGENTTGKPRVPTIEVVGTYDDFVRREVLAYAEKVARASAGARHRLYQVEGAWHISGDDDAIESFAFLAKRRGLGDEIQEAMRRAPSYIPLVQQTLHLLDRWVEERVPPPADRTVPPSARLVY